MALEGTSGVPVAGCVLIQIVVAYHLKEGDPHAGHGPLVFGVEREVVEHDVSAAHSESRAVVQTGDRRSHVGHCLAVQTLGL